MTDRQIDNRIEKLKKLKVEIARLEAERSRLEEQVKTALGDDETRETRNWKVTWTKYIAPVFHKDRIPQEMVEAATTYAERRRFGFARV